MLDQFRNSPIANPIAGLCVTDFPLWKLGCLLDENWLEEDVLNGMSELLYFRLAAASKTHCAPFLFFPTSFFSDAKYLYDQSPQLYSPKLAALRDSLRASGPVLFALITCIDGHYSGFYDTLSGQLEHGDSMGFPAASDMLSVLQWVMSGLDLQGYVCATRSDYDG
jgi:hypothetical protein